MRIGKNKKNHESSEFPDYFGKDKKNQKGKFQVNPLAISSTKPSKRFLPQLGNGNKSLSF